VNQTKRCFKCLQEKPLEAFYKHAQMRDGRLNKCIECAKADVLQNRLENIERYKQFDRQRAGNPERVKARATYRKTDAFRISHAVASKKWDVANAIRKHAHTTVNNALRDGRLVSQPCFICGSLETQAHHFDYSRPLLVSWLCAGHHAQLHQEHRALLRQLAA